MSKEPEVNLLVAGTLNDNKTCIFAWFSFKGISGTLTHLPHAHHSRWLRRF